MSALYRIWRQPLLPKLDLWGQLPGITFEHDPPQWYWPAFSPSPARPYDWRFDGV